MQVKRKTLIIAFGIAAVLSVSVIFTASGMKLYKTNALKKDSVVVSSCYQRQYQRYCF